MREGQINLDVATVLSALDWWIGAGVDVLVGDDPRNWLQTPAAHEAGPAEPQERAPAAVPPTLAALVAQLADPALAWAGPPTRRLAPAGSPAAGLMIIADQPDAEDADEGRLIGGAAGRLFDRMLAAIGFDRAGVYLAPLCPVASAGRRPVPATLDAATALMRTHIALAAPRRVLLLGDGAARALLGVDCAAARGRLHDLNHNGGTVPAVASLHPRILVRQPALKGESWKDLRLLMEFAA